MLRRSGATHDVEILFGDEGFSLGIAGAGRNLDSAANGSSEMMRIALGSEPRLLNILRCVVKFCAQEAGFTKTDGEYLALAIDEAAANIIRHTYGGRHDAS